MLMLTGARLSEVTDAAWSEFDLKAKMWTIPPERFKSDTTHDVPLSTEIIDLLGSLPRWPRCDFMFTRDGKKPVDFTDKAKRIPPTYVADVAGIGPIA